MIQFSNVSFQYKGSEAFSVHDVSFTVHKGDFTVLSSPTGSGKSTILKLLDRELKAATGSITVGNFDLTKISASKVAAYRRTIGCVFQDFRLLEEKTVFENVSFALEIQSNFKRKKIDSLVSEVLDRVGILAQRDQFPKALSLGEKQRTAIARAIVNEPMLLVVDNPTSQLDDVTAKQILSIFTSEHLRGMTIFFATTSTAPIKGLPPETRYLSMRNGMVVKTDRTD